MHIPHIFFTHSSIDEYFDFFYISSIVNNGVVSMWKWKLSHVQLSVVPWTIQSMQFSRPGYWSGEESFLSPGELPSPGVEPRSPTVREDSLPAEPQGYTYGCIYIFKLVFLVFLNIYPEVELLDHKISLLLGFWGTSILLIIMASPIYIATNSAWEFPLLHIFTILFLVFWW